MADVISYSGEDKWKKKATELLNQGGGGGSSTLAGLSDVNLTSPANAQVLKYNSTSQKWENANESGGGSTYTAGNNIDITNDVISFTPFAIVVNATDDGIDIVYDDGT